MIRNVAFLFGFQYRLQVVSALQLLPSVTRFRRAADNRAVW